MPTVCLNCASGLEEDAVVCVHCGCELKPEGASEPANAADLQEAFAGAEPTAPAPAYGSPIFSMNNDLEGIGGWLILVGFALCLTPIIRVSTLYQTWEGYFSAAVWQAVAMPQGGSYHPLYGPMLILEMLGNIFFLGLNLLALRLFFTRRKGFPKLYIAYLVGFAIFLILDDVGCELIPSLKSSGKDHTEAIRAAFYAILWSLYMIKSKRVKATFIR